MNDFIPGSIDASRLVKGAPDLHREDNNVFSLDALFTIVYPLLESIPIEPFVALTDGPPSIHCT